MEKENLFKLKKIKNMLKIIFSRRGKKNKPTYRIIVLDKRKDPFGDFLEDLGSYNPHTKKATLKVERIKYWLSVGAKPSETVFNLLVKNKVIDAPKIKIKIRKKREEKPAVEKSA